MRPNNALHLARGLAFARPPAGECERSASEGVVTVGLTINVAARSIGGEPDGSAVFYVLIEPRWAQSR
jgi:hypothetical protein